MASGLLRSMPMTTFLMPRCCLTAAIPRITLSEHSRNSRLSEVMYGSHSAPLMTRVSMAERSLGESLTAVGKPAPPRPTRPHACTAAMSEAWSVTSGGTQAGSGVCSPSALMTTAGTERPLGICTVSTASTVPDTPLWMAAPTKPPAAPTTVPTSTASPFFTVGVHGAPICCCMGSTIFSGRGMATVAIPDVFFSCGTRAPRALRLNLDDMKI